MSTAALVDATPESLSGRKVHHCTPGIDEPQRNGFDDRRLAHTRGVKESPQSNALPLGGHSVRTIGHPIHVGALPNRSEDEGRPVKAMRLSRGSA